MDYIEESLALAKGCYQRALILGGQRWSGSDLRGKASKYGALYAKSRHNLLERLEAAHLAHLRIGARGRIELHFGPPPVGGLFLKVRVSAGAAWKLGPTTALDDMVLALDETEQIGD